MKRTLGRYEIEKELGRGATSVVYLGRDLKINRQVVVKTMIPEAQHSSDGVNPIRTRFLRQAQVARHLHHPGIVRIFDASEEGGIAFIAMELLDGRDLRKYCERESLLPLETVLQICAETADALDYAHRTGVLHRDIKPANIIWLNDRSVRITDFGSACFSAPPNTSAGTVMGTPSYMSPEQVAGGNVDERTDLWSLGIVLYEMCTGAKPFKGDADLGSLLSRIASAVPAPATEYRPELSTETMKIIDKCLRKDPDQRYRNGAELAADLRGERARLKFAATRPANCATLQASGKQRGQS